MRNGALLYVLTLHQVALYNEQSWPMSKAYTCSGSVSISDIYVYYIFCYFFFVWSIFCIVLIVKLNFKSSAYYPKPYIISM